ncbi:hypothetical protein [Streptomyces sp. NBC_00631]|uniref:hypothetical protein n=1 Tax=Streptomyces sp. NBC_00631 TaxID=2975793 RepID=UPI003866034D
MEADRFPIRRGPPLLTRAFVPVVERNGGGRILNVHSVLSWIAEGGTFEALADDLARWAKGALSGDLAAMYRQLAQRRGAGILSGLSAGGSGPVVENSAAEGLSADCLIT